MAKTKSDIVRQALYELSVLEIEADDVAVFDLNTVADYLYGLRVADVRGDVLGNQLPDEYLFPFAKLAAAKYGNQFGLTREQQATLEGEAIGAFRLIINRARPVYRARFERMTY